VSLLLYVSFIIIFGYKHRSKVRSLTYFLIVLSPSLIIFLLSDLTVSCIAIDNNMDGIEEETVSYDSMRDITNRSGRLFETINEFHGDPNIPPSYLPLRHYDSVKIYILTNRFRQLSTWVRHIIRLMVTSVNVIQDTLYYQNNPSNSLTGQLISPPEYNIFISRQVYKSYLASKFFHHTYNSSLLLTLELDTLITDRVIAGNFRENLVNNFILIKLSIFTGIPNRLQSAILLQDLLNTPQINSGYHIIIINYFDINFK